MALHLRRLTPLTLAALALAATPAFAAPDRAVSTPLDIANPTITWTGKDTPGANTSFFLDSTTKAGTCAKTDQFSQCDETLVQIGNDKPKGASKITFRIGEYSVPTSDFDLRVYESNAAGAPLTKVGSPISEYGESSGLGGLDPRSTGAGDNERTELTGTVALKAGKYYLVQVVYFASAGHYKGSVKVEKLDPAPAPATGESLAGLR